jgi:putative membrane protein insertion efficiency factor
VKALILFAVNIYRKYMSPFLPHSCRFYPSCSSYFIEAVENFGILKGIWLFIRRIFKCHPLHPGGYDPVKHLDNSC